MNKITQETKELLLLFKDHLKEDFHLPAYFLILLFSGLGIYANEVYQLEDRYIDIHYGKWLRCIMYMVLYSIFYYGSVIILFINKDFRKQFNSKFLLLSCVGLVLIAFNSGLSWHHDVIKGLFDRRHYYYVIKIVVNVQRLLTWLLPLIIIYWLSKKWRPENFYGLTTKNFHFRPYLVLYAIMIPIILIAANTSSFLDYYPTLNVRRLKDVLGENKTAFFVLYEIIYGLDFTMVELMFRGFLVVGLSKVIGRHSIIPMAVLYMSFHFGKPTTEAVSSLFGGYILGILAFQSKNILGGVAIHAGIALLMDITSYWLKYGVGLNQ